MAQLINTKNTHTNTNTNTNTQGVLIDNQRLSTQGVFVDNNMLSIPGDVIQVIIEFLKYDSISNFYECLGKDISKTNIITFLSRKYKIIDNNKFFSKNKIDEGLWSAVIFDRKEIASMLLKVDGIKVNKVYRDGETHYFWQH